MDTDTPFAPLKNTTSLKTVLNDFFTLQGEVVIATQEPYGTYHLECLKNIIPRMIHLQPGEAREGNGVAVSNDPSIIDSAALLIITGGLLSDECAKAAQRARRAGVKVVFLELAYPQHSLNKPSFTPDLVIATTDGGYAVYKDYFGSMAPIIQQVHPALRGLPLRVATAKPSLLIGSTVSAETPDGVRILLETAKTLSFYSEFNVRVRLHPREDPSLWNGLNLTSGTTLAEDLSVSLAFLSYQTTAFLTANAMKVPCFHLAMEEWMIGRTPDGFAASTPVLSIDQMVDAMKKLMS